MILRTAADREVGDGDETQEKENGVLKGGNRAIARIIISESPKYCRSKTDDAKEENNLSRKMIWVQKYEEKMNYDKMQNCRDRIATHTGRDGAGQ